MSNHQFIEVKNARENNLKGIDITIPHGQLTVVTGVSGSGKSTLVYDIICKEGQRRYLESFSSYARQFLGKMHRPNVQSIDGLYPVVSVDQNNVVRNARSTVGTMTQILDHFRLLMARCGKSQENIAVPVTRSLFSFNTPQGACEHCKGLGVEDKIDPNLIIKDPHKSLREGALVITTPTGYTIYSQVTIDVMDRVCRSHGFDVDTPWEELSEEHQRVVFMGSDRLKIPFGKHTLQSRMKWSGIKAKPREEGYYKGIIPVMEEILRRDRNPNILRFVRSVPCSACLGKRFRDDALKIFYCGDNIATWCEYSIRDIHKKMERILNRNDINPVEESIAKEIVRKTNILIKLGVGYLSLDRESTTLSGGEQQRLSIANQLDQGLSNVLYIFDEPSIGLHAQENQDLIDILNELVNKGNTVIVVEHDEDFIRAAQWIIDIGPSAGQNGGEVLFCGSAQKFFSSGLSTPTLDYLLRPKAFALPTRRDIDNLGMIHLSGVEMHNIHNVEVDFMPEALNVVAGVSGAGKSSLVLDVLAKCPGDLINQVIVIDQTPIGRTPRSNPATYTKLFNYIRDLFALQAKSINKDLNKSHFSFNVKGGRCEKCEGAGVLQIGMHFMGNVNVPCPQCDGHRFNPEILEIDYHGKNIFQVLNMTIDQARMFFEGHSKMTHILDVLIDLGLGYLTLGQPSSSLSGGEAQRIKLSSHLCKPVGRHCLYILDEPTTGLHFSDVARLIKALQLLVKNHHTVVVIEHHGDVLKQADWLIDMGPGSGINGGKIMGMGTPESIAKNVQSPTSNYLRKILNGETEKNGILPSRPKQYKEPSKITLHKVTTHNLKGCDLQVNLGEMTIITGVSGSGKSSLAFDTLYAEAERRFTRGMSAYIRTHLPNTGKAVYEQVNGLVPCVAISQDRFGTNSRSTVGTLSEIYEIYRLLYSRLGKSHCTSCGNTLLNGNCPKCGKSYTPLMARHFSFNNQAGSCKYCNGLGTQWKTDPHLLVTHPHRSLIEGAMNGSKTGQFYGDPNGQHIALLNTVAKEFGVDFSGPYQDLSSKAKELAMYGCGNRIFDVNWSFKRGNRQGIHQFTSSWQGFVNLVDQEYKRKQTDKRGVALHAIMREEECSYCKGHRLNKESLMVSFCDKNIWELSQLTIKESIAFWNGIPIHNFTSEQNKIILTLKPLILEKMGHLMALGLDYLNINRSTCSLSGGEAQRLRIATQLSSGMQGICYVLDEPSRGLHWKDVENLIKVLKELKNKGNTLVVVEHHPEIIKQADYIIDMGPEGGAKGGYILAQGTICEIRNNPASLTAPYLTPKIFELRETVPKNYSHFITITNATCRNLKNLNVRVPLDAIVGIVGVSGSGKSTLLQEVLAQSANKGKSINCEKISGLDHFNQVVIMDQRHLGRTPSSTPATYTGIMNMLRKVFVATPYAKEKGYKSNIFSFNSKIGACPNCKGMGHISYSMDFLSDIWMECPKCKGSRFSQKPLLCKYNGKNIAQVLKLSVNEALNFFDNHKLLVKALSILRDVGLGYLKLGQPSNSLSTGESQRLRLATELIQSKGERKLFLLDEPTNGLHFIDIKKLSSLFHKLTQQGHSIIFVDHHPQLMMEADYLIELGPNGGPNGGELVAEGVPFNFGRNFNSATAKILKN